MAGVRSYTITAQYVHDVASFVRAGGFPAVASEAAGIPAFVFDEWLRLAERRSKNPLYRMLRESVRTAAAEARLSAEITLFKNKPETWLRYGPGKETPTQPGWSQAAKPVPRDNGPPNAAESPEYRNLVRATMQVLTPHPELVAQFTQLLEAKVQADAAEDEPEAVPVSIAENATEASATSSALAVQPVEATSPAEPIARADAPVSVMTSTQEPVTTVHCTPPLRRLSGDDETRDRESGESGSGP